MNEETRTERAIVRATAGLALLLMLALPASLIPLIWTGDWRWIASGVVAGLIGFGLGVMIRDGAKSVRP